MVWSTAITYPTFPNPLPFQMKFENLCTHNKRSVMSYTKYSSLEPLSEDQESFEYRPKTYSHEIQQFLVSRWVLVILAFGAGILAALGVIKLSESSQKQDLDFLSEHSIGAIPRKSLIDI